MGDDQCPTNVCMPVPSRHALGIGAGPRDVSSATVDCDVLSSAELVVDSKPVFAARGRATRTGARSWARGGVARHRLAPARAPPD